MQIVYSIAFTNGKGLAFIGEGAVTIIGPEEMQYPPEIINSGIDARYVQSGLIIENIVVENVGRGILILGSNVVISGVEARYCTLGTHISGYSSGSIYSSYMHNCSECGMLLTLVSPTFVLNNCNYNNNLSGVGVDSGSHNVIIDSCTFSDNINKGIQYSSGSSGIIRYCSIEGSRGGIVVGSSSTVEIIDSIILPASAWGMDIYNYSTVTGSGNIIHGFGSYPAIQLGASSIMMSESHILRGDGLAVYAIAGPGYVFDLRNNYWGTADAEEIEAAIWDAADDPNLGSFVQYMPFYGQPVSNGNMSFGEIKAMFRR